MRFNARARRPFAPARVFVYGPRGLRRRAPPFSDSPTSFLIARESYDNTLRAIGDPIFYIPFISIDTSMRNRSRWTFIPASPRAYLRITSRRFHNDGIARDNFYLLLSAAILYRDFVAREGGSVIYLPGNRPYDPKRARRRKRESERRGVPRARSLISITIHHCAMRIVRPCVHCACAWVREEAHDAMRALSLSPSLSLAQLFSQERGRGKERVGARNLFFIPGRLEFLVTVTRRFFRTASSAHGVSIFRGLPTERKDAPVDSLMGSPLRRRGRERAPRSRFFFNLF